MSPEQQKNRNKHYQQEQLKSCALCLEPKALCDSHIITDFFYDPILDTKRRMFARSVTGKKKIETKQSGYSEKLLCADCETHINKWERYISHIWFDKIEIKTHTEGNLIYLEGLDYKAFKLFQLSILWRASVTTLAFFRAVDLGPHAEHLRKMILASDPGQQNDYPCAMSLLLFNGQEIATDMIVEPVPVKPLTHGKAYCFIFGGFEWRYAISGFPVNLRAATVSVDGKITIIKKDPTEIPYMRDLVARILKSNPDITK